MRIYCLCLGLFFWCSLGISAYASSKATNGLMCAAAYESVADQIEANPDGHVLVLGIHKIEMFSRYPELTAHIYRYRQNVVLKSNQISKLKENDPAGYETMKANINIEPLYVPDNPLKPYAHPTDGFKSVFDLLTRCDELNYFKPVTNVLAYKSRASIKSQEPLTHQSCGAYYLVTAEAFRAVDTRYTQSFNQKVVKLASEEAGSTDQRRYNRYVQGYVRAGHGIASQLKSGALNFSQLNKKLIMCDAAFNVQTIDIMPFTR